MHISSLLLIQIYFDENEGGKDFTLFGKVYDKFGKLIMDRSILFNSDDAEKVAAKMYSSLISSLPIEGGVIKKNKKGRFQGDEICLCLLRLVENSIPKHD